MRDERDGNEKMVADAIAKGRFSEAAVYHLKTIGLRHQLSHRFPFSNIERIQASTRQLEIILQCAETPENMQALLPPNVEDLLQSDCQPLEHDDYGHLCARLGSFYMRSPERRDWDHTKKYLNLSLEHLVEVSPQPVPLITATAQDLVDVYDILEDRGSAEGLVKWLKRKTLSEFTDRVKIGRISTAKLWCQEKGFSVQRFDEVEPSKGCSPLAYAVSKKSYSEVETMLSFTERTSPPSDLASHLLLLAADTRSSEVARLLLAHGARVDIQDDHQRTVLHRCQHCPGLGNHGGLKVANLFLDNHGDLLDRQDQSGKTALFMACESGHFDMTDLLLKRGANPNIFEVNGKTALYMACEKGELNIVRRLLQFQANPNRTGPGGYTPLVVAVVTAAKRTERDRLEVVKELIKFHANPKIADHNGLDAIHHVGGPLSSELKRVLRKGYDQAESLSDRQSTASPMPLPSTEISSSVLGTKTGSRPFFIHPASGSISNVSKGSSISSRLRFSRSNATSSSKSSVFSRLSTHTSITAVSSPTSGANNEDQILNMGPLSRVIGKEPDVRRNALPLPAIPESAHSQHLDGPGPGNPPRDRGFESGYPANLLSVGNGNTPRYGQPDGSLSAVRQHVDNPRGCGSLSFIEELSSSTSATDVQSLHIISETSSDVVAESRDSSRQNLPLSLYDLFPALAQDTYKQRPGTSQNQGSGGRGRIPHRPSGNLGRSQGGASSATLSIHSHTSKKSDANDDPPDDDGLDGVQVDPDPSLSFACPFAKEYTARYFNCNFHKLARVKDVKQHLKRKHIKPENCPRCRMQFPDEEEKDRHIREGGCRISHEPEPDGITQAQATSLSRRVCAASQRDQWYEIFRIVCPRAESDPPSPYVDPDYGLFEFAKKHARPLVRKFLQEHAYTGPPDAAEIETFILMGLQYTIQAFLQPPSSTPGLGDGASGPGPVVRPQPAAPQTDGEDNMHIDSHDPMTPDAMSADLISLAGQVESYEAPIQQQDWGGSMAHTWEQGPHRISFATANADSAMVSLNQHPHPSAGQPQHYPPLNGSQSMSFSDNLGGSSASPMSPMPVPGAMDSIGEQYYYDPPLSPPSSTIDPSQPRWWRH